MFSSTLAQNPKRKDELKRIFQLCRKMLKSTLTIKTMV